MAPKNGLKGIPPSLTIKKHFLNQPKRLCDIKCGHGGITNLSRYMVSICSLSFLSTHRVPVQHQVLYKREFNRITYLPSKHQPTSPHPRY